MEALSVAPCFIYFLKMSVIYPSEGYICVDFSYFTIKQLSNSRIVLYTQKKCYRLEPSVVV